MTRRAKVAAAIAAAPSVAALVAANELFVAIGKSGIDSYAEFLYSTFAKAE